MMSRNSAAVRICLLVEIVSLWRPPLKMPTGPSGLAVMIAVRTSSVAIPALDRATGLSAIRTAGWSAPETVDLAHARHLRDALRNHGVGDVVHRAGRNRL